MMLDGLEPPTSVYETYAIPAATASDFYFDDAIIAQSPETV